MFIRIHPDVRDQTKGFEINDMLRNLPTSVQSEIMMYINAGLIERVPLFKQCSERFLEAIILRMGIQCVLANDYVFKEGELERENRRGRRES